MDISTFILQILGELPEWTADALMLIVIIVIALLAFGRTFVYLISAYRAKVPVPQVLDEAVGILIDTIDDSPLDTWLEKQIIAGKLPDWVTPVILTARDVADSRHLETKTEALRKSIKYLNDLMDGDLST